MKKIITIIIIIEGFEILIQIKKKAIMQKKQCLKMYIILIV